jgi:hypothetical protein
MQPEKSLGILHFFKKISDLKILAGDGMSRPDCPQAVADSEGNYRLLGSKGHYSGI